jgi:tRNA threonylcarbamoyl adenosine modification protein YeaZ
MSHSVRKNRQKPIKPAQILAPGLLESDDFNHDLSMLLALETSGKTASVALADQDSIVAIETPADRGSAQMLAPMIDQLLQSEGLSPKNLSSIAVTVGPGSFTGLRVGVAIAKTMAYGLSIPCIAVDTLEVLARQVLKRIRDDDGLIHPSLDSVLWSVLDAYRGELFAAQWLVKRDGDQHLLECTRPSHLISVQGLQANMMQSSISEGHGSVRSLILAGPGIKRMGTDWLSAMERDSVQSMVDCLPKAEQVAEIGLEKLAQSQTIEPMRLMPIYLRASAAEEKVRPRPSQINGLLTNQSAPADK